MWHVVEVVGHREVGLEAHRYARVCILRMLTGAIYGNSSGQDVRHWGSSWFHAASQSILDRCVLSLT